MLGLLVVAALATPQGAMADPILTYTYTGNTFTDATGSFVGSSVTGSFTIDCGLAFGAGQAPGDCSNLGNAGRLLNVAAAVTEFSFSAGGLTITSSDSFLFGSPRFFVHTGAASELLLWRFSFIRSGFDSIRTEGGPFAFVDRGVEFFSPGVDDRGEVRNRPGTWTLRSVTLVSIDIKPGSFPNSINPRSKGVTPVAILTTDTFDATTVDPLSVEFGPNGAMEVHERGHIEDVDGDSDLDLVLHFATQDTGIVCGDTSASLIGEIFDGQAIEGSDAIRIVGCPTSPSMPWLELLLLDD
jgi:hypothetical protein